MTSRLVYKALLFAKYLRTHIAKKYNVPSFSRKLIFLVITTMILKLPGRLECEGETMSIFFHFPTLTLACPPSSPIGHFSPWHILTHHCLLNGNIRIIILHHDQHHQDPNQHHNIIIIFLACYGQILSMIFYSV